MRLSISTVEALSKTDRLDVLHTSADLAEPVCIAKNSDVARKRQRKSHLKRDFQTI